jgi:hypothetical protein
MPDLIQQLSDRTEIVDLVTRLGLWLDEDQAPEAAASILTADATARTPGGIAEGRDALVAQARRNHAVPTQHVIANVLVDLDGDRADVGANLVVTFADGPPERAARPGLPAAGRTLGERYRFDVVRTAQGWRIAHVETSVRWTSGAAAA